MNKLHHGDLAKFRPAAMTIADILAAAILEHMKTYVLEGMKRTEDFMIRLGTV